MGKDKALPQTKCSFLVAKEKSLRFVFTMASKVKKPPLLSAPQIPSRMFPLVLCTCPKTEESRARSIALQYAGCQTKMGERNSASRLTFDLLKTGEFTCPCLWALLPKSGVPKLSLVGDYSMA